MHQLARPKLCDTCGSSLDAAMPSGFCPSCLLDTVLGTQPDGVASTRIEDYELLSEVARGGMGIVYRARQKAPSRVVALKMILPAHLDSPAAVNRFRAEAETAASLDHESILPIYAVGEHDSVPFFTMKFAEGGTLAARIGDYRDKPRDAAALVAKLARAVGHAHERGILHRDLKPGNILFGSAGKPYVSDFGLAKWLRRDGELTQTLAILGTPYYMAPEQAIDSRAVTAAADIYSLGAILYHLLSGEPPISGDNPVEVVHRAASQSPKPLRGVSRDLATICLKCIENEPKARYSSAADLADDLERWLKNERIRARPGGIFVRMRRWTQRHPSGALLLVSTSAILALALVVGWKIGNNEAIPPPNPRGIAVLPFEHLSGGKEDAALTEGVQDDILTRLAKIADLKVISRSSVMEYRGSRNARKIGKELRVSHVLAGSIRRTAARIYLNIQLIDTRTDTHVWAEQYDRDPNEAFAVPGEVAQTVAERLGARITAEEKAAIARGATGDVDAFELYARARKLLPKAGPIDAGLSKASEVVALLDQAVARDPSFFLAYLLLARVHGDLYRFGQDHSQARLTLMEAALREASRLRPDAGETHLQRAIHLSSVQDHAGALAELEIAAPKLPNDPSVVSVKASIQRRQGLVEESIRNFQRATELDPRNPARFVQLGLSYLCLRRYSEQAAVLDRALAIEPHNLNLRLQRAIVEVDWKADPRPLHQFFDSLRTANPGAVPEFVTWMLTCALAERDIAAATEALTQLGGDTVTLDRGAIQFSPRFVEGLIARIGKDERQAQLAFAAARAEQEKIVEAQPGFGPALCALGLIDAALGRKEEALREGRRAVDLVSAEHDAITRAVMIKYLATIAAWVNEKDLACEQLAKLEGYSSLVSHGDFKLMPWWDPLRGQPCFEKIVEAARHPVVPSSH